MDSQSFTDDQLLIVAERLLNQIQEHQDISSSLKEIPVGISNRHLHLCQRDVEILFGKNYELFPQRYLSQPGQFAAKEAVSIVGPKGSISHVRVLGPVRKASQLEISKTDSFQLGVSPPVNESGDLNDAATLLIVGPQGSLRLTNGVIIARRHIHMTPEDARAFNVTNGESVAIRTGGERELIFLNTLIRVDRDFRLECHLDTDEANAAGLMNKQSFVEIIKEL